MNNFSFNRKNNIEFYRNKEIFEVHPIILGGSPTDQENKVVLTRDKHIEAVRYWNNVIKDIKENNK